MSCSLLYPQHGHSERRTVGTLWHTVPWREEPAPRGRPPSAEQVVALAAVSVFMEVAEAGAGGGMWVKAVQWGPSHHFPY